AMAAVSAIRMAERMAVSLAVEPHSIPSPPPRLDRCGERDHSQPAGKGRRRENRKMTYYLIQAAFSPNSTKALMANPQPREDVVRKSCESLGGKLHSFFFSFGEFDSTVIVELPDNKAAASLALAVAGSGALSRYMTTVLMTATEAVEA